MLLLLLLVLVLLLLNRRNAVGRLDAGRGMCAAVSLSAVDLMPTC